MDQERPDRMSGTKLDTRWRTLSKFCRWLTGDWWFLEEQRGVWGVWHPWRFHRWENYLFTKQEAIKERDRRNSGYHYEMCEKCRTTYAGHKKGFWGGIECPNLKPQ